LKVLRIAAGSGFSFSVSTGERQNYELRELRITGYWEAEEAKRLEKVKGYKVVL
jgi:hypothetical protein